MNSVRTRARRRTVDDADHPSSASAAPGFRPSTRSVTRIAAGVLLMAVAVAVVLTVFAKVDRRTPVLQVTRDVPAGDMLLPGDVRIVEVAVDASVDVVAAADEPLIVGQYAKVRMTAGSLLSGFNLQAEPLVAPGSAIVAITTSPGELPIGLRERSQVLLVFASSSVDVAAQAPVVGRVVGLPSTVDSITGTVSVSVEVAAADAVTVGSTDAVRLVLLNPGTDPASVIDADPDASSDADADNQQVTP